MALEYTWPEVFDPDHRPAPFTGKYFKEWLAKVDPDSKTYDQNYRDTFFQYLSTLKDRNLYKTRYLSTELARKAYEVVVWGDYLYRPPTNDRQAHRFHTADMLVNDVAHTTRVIEYWKKNGRPNAGLRDAKGRAMWVISADGKIYSGSALDGDRAMHHTGFLAGGAVMAAEPGR